MRIVYVCVPVYCTSLLQLYTECVWCALAAWWQKRLPVCTESSVCVPRTRRVGVPTPTNYLPVIHSIQQTCWRSFLTFEACF